MNIKQQTPALIRAMLEPGFYSPPVKSCELIETHISWVILTGSFVYKIKKPVDFGFLDFSSLEKRKFYCEEELRLNQRLAPEIYLEVITIHGTEESPVFNDDGRIVEYAVKMMQFPQHTELDQLLKQGKLTHNIIDSISELIADFHQQIDVADNDSEFGEPGTVLQPVKENFNQIRERVCDNETLGKLLHIEQWSDKTFNKLKSVLKERQQNGFIRECHGDLHLRNLAWYQNTPLAFDCLEFNAQFRWIDVMSEVAFLIMDLKDHLQPELASRFLNRYLEVTGDYAGCSVLNFYQVYRAMVRAKVEAIRLQQTADIANKDNSEITGFTNYLKLAENFTRKKELFILITRGVSGSGKSTITGPLSEKLGAIRIRSDIERKRLFSVNMDTHHHTDIAQGIYSAQATEKTYLKLLELAEIILQSGFPVIIDATFSDYKQRQLFSQLAKKYHSRYLILELQTENKILKQRVTNRKNDVSDANLDVLTNQLNNWQPLEETEIPYTFSVDTGKTPDIGKLIQQLEL